MPQFNATHHREAATRASSTTEARLLDDLVLFIPNRVKIHTIIHQCLAPEQSGPRLQPFLAERFMLAGGPPGYYSSIKRDAGLSITLDTHKAKQ
jgi:hypothetical protein